MTPCSVEGCAEAAATKGMCRTCYKRTWRKSKQQNESPAERERRLGVRRARYDKNRDKLRAEMREYHASHRDEAKTRSRKFHQLNPDYNRQHYLKNRDHYLELNAQWRREHLEWYRAREARRRQRRTAGMTKSEIAQSVQWRRDIKDDPCFYCGVRSEQMHDDHMLPVARGGTDHWWNLVRSCADCNFRKHTKTAEEFLACMEGVSA